MKSLLNLVGILKNLFSQISICLYQYYDFDKMNTFRPTYPIL